ncbi:MAG: dUTP diphosphatase [Firmicutes bacterium]|nr:dUTP diphosphatase [Candidatus Caballimonas caccae]
MLNCKNKDKSNGRFVKSEDVIVKFKRTTLTSKKPTKATEYSAGYDLYVDIGEPVIIKPHSTIILSSGIITEIPKGYLGAIYARSGLSTKSGIRPATCVSIIDSDYRGVIGIPLHNDSEVDRIIAPYERVAQFIIHEIPKVELKEVSSIDDFGKTERGDNGFGSSGK